MSLSDLLSGHGAVMERLLMREFSHRINDELAAAVGLISAAANRCTSDEARAALVAVHERLRSQADVQHSLQMPDYTTTIDLTAYLYQLCRAISRSKLESEGIELSLSVCPLRLGSERCWFVGMIVFELIMGAARQVFREATGSIHLEICPAGDSIEICMTDNGSSEAGRCRATDIPIVAGLAAGLNATVDMQTGPNETRATVSFPPVA